MQWANGDSIAIRLGVNFFVLCFFWFYCTSCSLPDIEHVSKEKLNLCMLGSLSCFFVVCWFFQNQLFQKVTSGLPSECQTVWTQIRPDILSGLIWVQTVCKGYQQTTQVGKELKEKLKENIIIWLPISVKLNISKSNIYLKHMLEKGTCNSLSYRCFNQLH